MKKIYSPTHEELLELGFTKRSARNGRFEYWFLEKPGVSRGVFGHALFYQEGRGLDCEYRRIHAESLEDFRTMVRLVSPK